jgi:hypothetical protein
MTRHHSDFLSAYTEAFGARSEAPERFHFWAAVSAIGGVLRRRVYIDEGTYRYYPNFYVLLVAPPGVVKKSTTIGIAKGLLRRVPGINIGADCATWQAFVEEVANAQDFFADGDDPQADLIDQVHNITCAITHVISEFGTFFDPNDRIMVNILTELFDCKIDDSFRKATKTQGDDNIMNPFVNMLAGTTPRWVQDNFRGRFGGWGLSSRIMFLYADHPEQSIAYPHKVWVDKYERVVEGLSEDLIEISKLCGRVTLTPDAEAFGEDWYKYHCDRIVTLNANPHHDPWLSYYLARKFDHVHKLALVLSASRGHSLRVELSDIETAVERCGQIEDELAKIFRSRETASREVNINMTAWAEIAAAIKSHEYVTVRWFRSHTVRLMTYGQSRALFDQLISSRWLTVEAGPEDGILRFGENAVLDDST